MTAAAAQSAALARDRPCGAPRPEGATVCFSRPGGAAGTVRCEIRYHSPAREGEKLLLVGRQTARKRKLVEMQGTATRASDGAVVATATATFVVIDEEEFTGVGAGG